MVDKDSWTISSPDGSISLNLGLEEGRLFYTVAAHGNQVIDSSSLGMVRSDTDLSQGLSFIKESAITQFEEEAQLVTGKQLTLKATGNHQLLTFTNQQESKIQVELKVFDDGLAIRYVFPDTLDQPVTLLQDQMSFVLPQHAKCWLQPYDTVTTYTPAYERFYENGINTGITGSSGNGWCMPALFNTGNSWLLISEAAKAGDIAGCHLDNEAGSSVYSLRWPENGEAMGMGESQPSAKLPWSTSWKTLAIGELNDIVKSDLVKLVSDNAGNEDTSWIKPGRSSWSWLSDHPSPQDYRKLKEFVDLAAEMGWEYSLVDANWDQMKRGSIVELIDYAATRGVGIFMWYNSGGPHNQVTEAPRNLISDPTRRQQEFQKLRKWGVKGIKVDFFQSDKQLMMELYRDILEDAAAYQIMVNFHGCAIPRGWSRTYPNLMTMEAVRGAECYTFDSEYPGNAPVLNTILPFTRNVIGSMDYTPVIFTNMENPHITTYGHEMALSVVFESGLLHFGDAVRGYQSLGDIEKEFLKQIPVTWDQVELLQGTPGKDVIIARKKGDSWYIGGINGEEQPKSWKLDLSRFGANNELTIIADGESPAQLEATVRSAKATEEIRILPYGGFVMKLAPVSNL